MTPAPVVLHLIDGFGIGGAQQRFFNDLEHLGPPFEHWPCAVFEENGTGVQGTRVAVPRRTLGARHLRGLPVAVATLAKMLRDTPSIRVVHTQLFAADTVGRVGGMLCGRAVISTVQASIYEPESGLYSRWRHEVDRVTARVAARVVAVSEYVRQSVHRRLDVPLDRIVVIHNTVDTERVRPDARRRMEARAALGLADATFAWLTVGRLHPAKGLADLLDAFAGASPSRRDAVLLIAGRGPQLAELEARARDLNVAERVRFLGERGDVVSLLDATDGFAFPSYSEGLPVSLLEAMAMEKPCVASRIGPHEEVITDDECGRLIAPRDSASLAAAMTAIQDDPGIARRLGSAGRRRVEAGFEARRGARSLMDLYATLC
jgi:glycosyltransferase involved in cell wall biosynthesis